MLSDSPWFAWPAPGSPDFTFNRTGVAYADPSTAADATQSVAVDPLGRTLVAANGGNGVSVTRLTVFGTPDTTFGTNGNAAGDYFHGGFVTSMVALPDGKVVLAGLDPSLATDADGNPAGEFAMVRLNRDGSQDTSFGQGGEAATHFAAGSSDFATRVALDKNLRLVVGGTTTAPDGTRSFAAARYTYDGAPDARFGADHSGHVVVAATQLLNVAGLAIDGSTIVLGGNAIGPAGFVFSLTRLKDNGQVAHDFGSGGVATVDPGGPAFMADLVTVNGKFVVGGGVQGATGSDFFLAGIDSRGRLDASFGTGGFAETDIGAGGDDEVLDLAVQNNKIVAVGNSGLNVAVARYTARGALDSSFGTAGVVLSTSPATQLGSVHTAAMSATVWLDRIIVAATHPGSSTNDDQIEVLSFLG